MDTIIALGIIAIACIFVFRRVYTQMKNKKAGGCGCSGGCATDCASAPTGKCGCGQEKHGLSKNKEE
ncbi:FeoB-associated Cys-rich membrane protein [Pseudodesulfovibrio sp.]|uniref:FeoB-associated Cys-rich membrane protein n=1 Tax=unclassified Pseudodesulfovibrio TaxID=2661612 RepID=UPI003B00B7C0